MHRVNKPLYVGIYLAGVILGLGCLCQALIIGLDHMDSKQVLIILLSNTFLLLAFAVVAILVYKMWAVIPANLARTTPGKAVGFLFIPFYHFYWYFQAYWGWAKDWNAYAKKTDGKLRQMPEALPLTIAILASSGAILGFSLVLMQYQQASYWFGFILGLLNNLVMLIFIWKVCDIVNQAPEVPLEFRADFVRPGPPDGPCGYGVASLVLGILSIVLPFVGLICGILAIVFASVQKKRFREGLSLGGLITGIIGSCFWGLMILVMCTSCFLVMSSGRTVGPATSLPSQGMY